MYDAGATVKPGCSFKGGRGEGRVSCLLSTFTAEGLFKWRIDLMSKSYHFSLLEIPVCYHHCISLGLDASHIFILCGQWLRTGLGQSH